MSTFTWTNPGKRIGRDHWDLLCTAANHVFTNAGIKLAYSAERGSPPATNESAIRFNGRGYGNIGADFVLNRNDSGSVDTRGCAYGVVVGAVLSLAARIVPEFRFSGGAIDSLTQEQRELVVKLADAAYDAVNNAGPAVPEPRAEVCAPSVASVQPDVAAAMQTLIAALGAGKAAPGTVDATAVRAIVTDELSKLAIARPIEIKVADREPAKVDGPTHKVLPDVLKLLANGMHVFLVGPSGSGKTTLAIQAAHALGRKLYLTGAILQKYELLGYQDANGRYVRSSFRDAFEHGGVFLWDEIDASNPAALVAFNAALENGHGDFPDGQIQRHADFICIAGGNTYGQGATREYIGRNALDGASLERFAMLDVDYDEALERQLAGNDDWVREVQSLRKAAAKLGVKHIISPRASIKGAIMLKAGMSRDAVRNALVWKGLGSEQRAKLVAEAGVR